MNYDDLFVEHDAGPKETKNGDLSRIAAQLKRREMRIFELRLRELVPYANNPRNNVNAVEAVANSIKQFGFKVPIVVDAKKKSSRGTRVLAAALLGMETCAVRYC